MATTTLRSSARPETSTTSWPPASSLRIVLVRHRLSIRVRWSSTTSMRSRPDSFLPPGKERPPRRRHGTNAGLSTPQPRLAVIYKARHLPQRGSGQGQCTARPNQRAAALSVGRPDSGRFARLGDTSGESGPGPGGRPGMAPLQAWPACEHLRRNASHLMMGYTKMSEEDYRKGGCRLSCTPRDQAARMPHRLGQPHLEALQEI